jgi:hypothetical protein
MYQQSPTDEPRVVCVSNDGFPVETYPATGEITIHYSDGTVVTQRGTRRDYNRLREQHGLPADPDTQGRK